MSNDLKEQVASLLSTLFASADQRGQAAAAGFAECFTEYGQFKAGPQAALKGRKGKGLQPRIPSVTLSGTCGHERPVNCAED